MPRGLIKYQGAPEHGRGEAWQSQVDMAALKFMVVTLVEISGVAAGLYIGAMT